MVNETVLLRIDRLFCTRECNFTCTHIVNEQRSKWEVYIFHNITISYEKCILPFNIFNFEITICAYCISVPMKSNYAWLEFYFQSSNLICICFLFDRRPISNIYIFYYLFSFVDFTNRQIILFILVLVAISNV